MIVACHFDPKSSRSENVARAMAKGIQGAGDQVVLTVGFAPCPKADVGLAYGWAHPKTFNAYRAAGKHFVYVDLGWWDRKPDAAPLEGFHKVVVDGRCPSPYLRGEAPGDRFARLGLAVKPWRRWRPKEAPIILAGMSEKNAVTYGKAAEEWEWDTVDRLRQFTARPIVYRPKPSWFGAEPIPGTEWGRDKLLDEELARAWAVVTLYSNVGIDGLIAGVPLVGSEGVAKAFSSSISMVEAPRMPEGREALLHDLAYCQWTPREMRTGECWRWLKKATPLCE